MQDAAYSGELMDAEEACSAFVQSDIVFQLLTVRLFSVSTMPTTLAGSA
jgi:hypothetical protein